MFDGATARTSFTMAILGSSAGIALLIGVNALDPITYGGVALVLVAVASLASWLPAHRAATVDPSRALREE